jgi:hypothetical protein
MDHFTSLSSKAHSKTSISGHAFNVGLDAVHMVKQASVVAAWV